MAAQRAGDTGQAIRADALQDVEIDILRMMMFSQACPHYICVTLCARSNASSLAKTLLYHFNIPH